MKENLHQKCELFTKNRDLMKRHFILENRAIYPLCAYLMTEAGQEINVNQIKEAKEIIKEGTGLFSNFKGMTLLVLATKLSLEENPRAKFKQIMKVYNSLKEVFWSSTYLPLAAFAIAQQVEEQQYEVNVRKAKIIYEAMKKNHPFLTSKEDVSFAALFAMTNLPLERMVREMENCYELLHSEFFSDNAVQALSHALAFGEEEAKIKCQRVMALFNRLKDQGLKYGTGIELATLGLLALVTVDVEETIREACEVNRYLLEQDGFGMMGIGKVQRLMYCCLLVAGTQKKEILSRRMNTTMMTSITSLMIAEQVAVAAAAGAAIAASSVN